MSLEIRKPGEACPRQDPGDSGKQDPSPAPPGEGEKIWFRGGRCTLVCPYQTDEEEEEPCENEKGISNENGPRKRRILDIGCPGREFQVKCDILVNEEDPQNREPQQHYHKQGRYDDGPFHGPNDWEYILSSVRAQSKNFFLVTICR